MNKESIIKAGKKSRNHLNLPIMSYIVADDWIDKVGYKRFHFWLKFHTWVDRTDAAHVENVIPYSFEKVYEKLGISKATFFRDIPVLWEFGLIDIVEYEQGKQKGTNPRNIVVYEYPFNDITKKYEPLEKLRDWKKDYQSQSKTNGQKGAVIQKANKLSTKRGGGLKNETVENYVDKSLIGGLKNESRGGLTNETGGVSRMRANNYSNTYNNLTNDINNYSNKNLNQEVEVDSYNQSNNFHQEQSDFVWKTMTDVIPNLDLPEEIKIHLRSLFNQKKEKSPQWFNVKTIEKIWNELEYGKIDDFVYVDIETFNKSIDWVFLKANPPQKSFRQQVLGSIKRNVNNFEPEEEKFDMIAAGKDMANFFMQGERKAANRPIYIPRNDDEDLPF